MISQLNSENGLIDQEQAGISLSVMVPMPESRAVILQGSPPLLTRGYPCFFYLKDTLISRIDTIDKS